MIGFSAYDPLKARSQGHPLLLQLVTIVLLVTLNPSPVPAQQGLSPAIVSPAIASAIPKSVKIFGSGGSRGLEAWQSGFLVSGQGHVLTSWSYVLDSDVITVTLDDGFKAEADLVGFDARLEIAVLKIDAADVPFFNLDTAVQLQPGSGVLAFSNLYGVATGNEPVSVQHGVVSSIGPLAARRGAFASPYQGDAYLIDAMTNNPGAAGGVLTDRQGRIAAIIGKELRDSRTGQWLNYAIPVASFKESVDRIRKGEIATIEASPSRRLAEPMTLDLLGISLVPDVIRKTPPYVDRVITNSPAQRQGIQADDLIVEINQSPTASYKAVVARLQQIDRDQSVSMTIQRKNSIINVKLKLTD